MNFLTFFLIIDFNLFLEIMEKHGVLVAVCCGLVAAVVVQWRASRSDTKDFVKHANSMVVLLNEISGAIDQVYDDNKELPERIGEKIKPALKALTKESGEMKDILMKILTDKR